MDQRKQLVRDAYDAVARVWGEQRRTIPRSRRERAWFERFLALLPDGSRTLDLGCGVGAPILVDLLARGHRAVGVDFSSTSLREARVNSPGAALVRADLANVAFEPASFEGLIAFDSLWHLPHEDHPSVFADIRRWLVPSGLALLTLAAAPPGECELFTELLGVRIYYAALPEAESLRLLRDAGLSPLDHHLEHVDETRPDTGHLIVLARAT